jgi:hypothetical protein
LVALSHTTEIEYARQKSKMVFLGFALSECTVAVEARSVKYVRAVHRTALELAIHNYFGVEVGGFWLTSDQIAQLRSLADYYPPDESALVGQAIEAYLAAQLSGEGRIPRSG